jgi:hypothetical protein
VKRRTFLKLGAAAAGAATLGGGLLRRAGAAPFGEFPRRGADALLPESERATSVLEIFLYGGLSAWETLYCVPTYGRPDDPDPELQNTQLYAFESSLAEAKDACGIPSDDVGSLFGQDALGVDVNLGPFAARLRGLTHLTDRMRLIVQKHLLEPHEAAVPQALTGRPVGQPAAAGLGAHIQRYFLERAGTSRTAPFAYLFATGGLAGDNVSAATNTGLHPGAARPLQVTITNAARFTELLERGRIGDDRAAYDELMDVYVAQYRDRLRFAGEGDPVRSAQFTDLALGAATVADVDAIADVMDPALFVPKAGTACEVSNSFDVPGMSLQAARHLLTHPTQPARYVCVSDIGLYEASGGGGYDTHSENEVDTARNFDNLIRGLDEIVNHPGERDPTKLDLDSTLIILNTEFGRTPWPQDGGSGRNHHPYGYVTAFLGGPITAARKGIYGAIGPDGRATSTHATPAENRIAALLALGIWPFSPEAFAVSDVRQAGSEEEAALLVLERVLGVAP